MVSMALRIPDEMKNKMKRVKINWSHYLRESIAEALQSAHKRELLVRMKRWVVLTSRPSSGTAARLIRHGRDHA